MTNQTFFGKQRLCYTEVTDFTNYQGIGHDPMYKRYDSVYSVIKRYIPIEYQHFLATPEYLQDTDQICWHIEKWNEDPVRLKELSQNEYVRYKNILIHTYDSYLAALKSIQGEDLQILSNAIRDVDEDRIFCCDGKVYLIAWGMHPDTNQHKIIGSIIHEYDVTPKYKITFNVGDKGTLSSPQASNIVKKEGYVLTQDDIPSVQSIGGWFFTGWDKSPVGVEVTSDLAFNAMFEPIRIAPEPPRPPVFYTCNFDSDRFGTIEGNASVTKIENSTLSPSEIPTVKANKGYIFKGWNISPTNCIVNRNMAFKAIYEKEPKKPWWAIFTAKGWLKWLLGLLLLLLLILLFTLIFKGCCNSCSGHKEYNGIVPIDTVKTEDGRIVDDNGVIVPVTGDDGELPDEEFIVAPIMEEGGSEIPIIEQPGAPSIIANRLFLFMEDEDDDIESLATDFKKQYPGNKYSIIGYDKEVKMLVIQVPENERNTIRKTINDKISNHNFIVFDEEIYELKSIDNGNVSVNRGWHLSAINLKNGWEITRGSPDIKVAVVDDGIDAHHPIFKDRITDAYNVFTQNNRLSKGEGHGTHTAGLAAGSAQYYNNGAAGVAPECKIMPIQVFDNKQCPLSALVAGIMYAIHHDADVVNISIGPSFPGLNMLPVEQQKKIAEMQFKNVEKLWKRICNFAAEKNSILVFSAGNDDILSSIPPENRNAAAIVVAASDKKSCPTEFTNYGPCSDISAPGVDIYSSFPTSSFKALDGTSMSAPIITGTIALMKSLKRDLTVTEARNVLYKSGADSYGPIPPVVLVDKALQCVKNGDFSKPKTRQSKPVRDDNTKIPERKRVPMPPERSNPGGPVRIIDDPSDPVEIVDRPRRGEIDNPSKGKRGKISDETDYEAIRRLIAIYKKKIENLEKLLPKNNK